MNRKFSQNIDYWVHKTKTFLHDPPDKAIHIPGHEERANRIIEALGLAGSTLDRDEYHEADCIAAGMDRATLPGYVKDDDNRNGAVNFLEKPKITHPTGSDDALMIKFREDPEKGKTLVESICTDIEELVKKDLGTKTNGRGLSEKEGYRGREENFAPARFHYLYFLLRRRLAGENIGGLGGLWHRLPADTRLPDHSIWQHNGLVSALASCAKLSDHNRASLMVYALTPVQDFIGRARKLRDYWSGSLLLSWLAFEGIKAVMYRYGADHIIYPSLHGQPLIEGLLREWQMDEEWLDRDMEQAGVASFPNKFVCLVPTGEEKEAASAIEEAISRAWNYLGTATLEFVEKKLGEKDPNIKKQFQEQMASYWEHHWAAVPLVRGDDREQIKELLHPEAFEKAFRFLDDSRKIYKSNTDTSEGPLYSVSHRLAQAMLAAGKSYRQDLRGKREKGIKCDMFGEFEILHYGNESDHNPASTEDPFWQRMRQTFGESEFGRTERLCALALVKRMAHRVCGEMAGHPLRRMFKKAGTFPSTTEMAMHDWWQNLNLRARDQDNPEQAKKLAEELACFRWPENKEKIRRKLAQWYHEINEPDSTRRLGRQIAEIDEQNERDAARKIINRLHPVKNIHRYYAVLMMDGDRMGKLVNGETLGCAWENVLHPDLVERLKSRDFDPRFKKFWSGRLAEKRLVSPAAHAAISEALGDFSLYTVPAIVARYNGHLIYAGGDDVCAVLPASTVINAAREISRAYGSGFVRIGGSREKAGACTEWDEGVSDKLAVHLGRGDDISISAGILIVHHKKPLAGVIRRAHDLLDIAKKQGGRNGFALELDKRSGGGRLFRARWDKIVDGENMLSHFLATADALQATEQTAMSSSLAYRLATFKDGIRAIIATAPDKLSPFIAKQLDRSGLNREMSKDERQRELARVAGHLNALIARPEKDGDLPLEGVIIANFIGHCRREYGGRL